MEKQSSASVNPTNYSINSFEVLGGNLFFNPLPGGTAGPPSNRRYGKFKLFILDFKNKFFKYFLITLSFNSFNLKYDNCIPLSVGKPLRFVVLNINYYLL